MRKACRGSHGALVLEAARANGDIVSARKGDAGYTLTARGHSAHAGVEPEKGRNAGYRALLRGDGSFARRSRSPSWHDPAQLLSLWVLHDRS